MNSVSVANTAANAACFSEDIANFDPSACFAAAFQLGFAQKTCGVEVVAASLPPLAPVSLTTATSALAALSNGPSTLAVCSVEQ